MRALSKEKKVKVRVSSSIANLGPGFDIFGLSLKKPLDYVEVQILSEKKVTIEISGRAGNSIPINPVENTAGIVAENFIKEFSIGFGLAIHIEKGIRHSCGLGSSGASAAATAFAIDSLLDLGLSKSELVSRAALGEVVSSGIAHADNVSAAIMGGFTIIRSYDPIEVHHINPPKNLGVCIAIPNIPVPRRKTAEARKILPINVTLKQLTYNVGHAASMVYGMMTKDVALIGRAMSDSVVEPARTRTLLGYETVRTEAFKAGAAGVVLCGAGPSVAAFFDLNESDQKLILNAMRKAFNLHAIHAEVFVTSPGDGVMIV